MKVRYSEGLGSGVRDEVDGVKTWRRLKIGRRARRRRRDGIAAMLAAQGRARSQVVAVEV